MGDEGDAVIEVIRVIRYRYETPERMANDMKRWTASHASPGMSMDSQTFIPTWSEPIQPPGGQQ